MKPCNEENATINDVYQIVTDQIIAALERGVIPWRKPWSAAAGGSDPYNFKSKKEYRGINWFMLGLAPHECKAWGSFKQITEAGGTVRKGEKSSLAIFWKMLIGKDKATGAEKKIPMLRYYRVFNLEQCDGIALPTVAAPILSSNERIEICEKIVTDMPQLPTLRHTGGRAYYTPALDSVTMPEMGSFTGSEEYYATLFHELAHATGHKSRLGRVTDWAGFGSDRYAKEELVAEMASAFVCARAGILAAPLLENSAAYLQSWLRKFKEDRKLVVVAAAQAAKAADFILGTSFDTAEAAPVADVVNVEPVAAVVEPSPHFSITAPALGQLSLF